MDADLQAALQRAQHAGQAKRARQAVKQESARDQNRAEMPNVAALVDEFRALGFKCRVKWAEDLETGKKVGQL